MPTVNLRENDSLDVALRRFKRACEKAGILSKLRQIEHHEKRTAMRKRKKAAAVKRELKRLKKEQEVIERSRARRFNFNHEAFHAKTTPAAVTEESTTEEQA